MRLESFRPETNWKVKPKSYLPKEQEIISVLSLAISQHGYKLSTLKKQFLLSMTGFSLISIIYHLR